MHSPFSEMFRMRFDGGLRFLFKEDEGLKRDEQNGIKAVYFPKIHIQYIMTTLKKGDKAPAISAIDQLGNPISLDQYAGKKVILYFYPKDDTPGCTAEACNLRDNYTEILNRGFDVIGVSPDAGKAHLKFIDKYTLPFRLIADTDKKVAEDYGVWGLKKFMGKEYMGVNRTTFIIGDDGSILDVIEKVDTKNHAAQII